MNDVEVLESYRYACAELAALQEQMAMTRVMLEPGNAQLDRGSAEAMTLERHVEKCQAQAEAEQKRCLELLEKCDEILAGVKKLRTRTILRSYYIVGKTDSEIAVELGVCPRTVNRERRMWKDRVREIERNRKGAMK